MAKYTKEEVKEALTELRRLLKPGSTVYTVCTHVSASGMTRHISCFTTWKNPYTKKQDIRRIDHLVAKVCGFRRLEYKEGLLVQGCGMDMGFHVVYAIGRSLYPKGFKLAKKGKEAAMVTRQAAIMTADTQSNIDGCNMTQCTCNLGRILCNSAFVYDPLGETVAEIPLHLTPRLKEGFTSLCAGAALQKLNRELKGKRHAKKCMKQSPPCPRKTGK